MTIKTEVYCNLQIEGTHYWLQCPFEEVDYLRDPHRHMFFIKAYKEVTHSDRDVEFIMLKHSISNFLFDKYYRNNHQLHVFGSMSCEMIGQELMDEFGLSRVDVSEDNENGAIVSKENAC